MVDFFGIAVLFRHSVTALPQQARESEAPHRRAAGRLDQATMLSLRAVALERIQPSTTGAMLVRQREPLKMP